MGLALGLRVGVRVRDDRIMVQLHGVIARIGGHDRKTLMPRVACETAHLVRVRARLGKGLG